MATESPIRILERTDQWPTLKQHMRYRPPSAEMATGDLGMCLPDQRFNSHVDDVVPSRSESAPPSMEGSIAAIDVMFSKKISISSLEDLSPSLRGDSEIDLDHKGSLNSWVSSFPHGGITVGDLRSSRTKTNLLAHKEESGDDQLLDGSRDLVLEPNMHGRELNTATIIAKDNDPVDSVRSGDASGVSHLDKHIHHHKEPLIPSNNIMPQQKILQESSSYQVEGSYPPINYPVMSHPYGGLNHTFHYGTSSASAAEVQPAFQSSGFTPPLFNTTASFMTPSNQYYPHMQQSGFFPSQYNMPYNYNSAYVAGYPHQGSVPVAFSAGSFLSSGVADSGNVHESDPQSLMKFYGQLGTPMQSHYPVQYFQPGIHDMYGTIYGRFDHQTQIGGSSMTQMSSRESRKGSEIVGMSSDGPQNLFGVTYNDLNPTKGIVPSQYSIGGSTYADPLTQLTAPYIVSPVNSATPEAGNNYSGGRYYGRHSQSSAGNFRRSSGFQSQNWNDLHSHSLLEELKSGKGPRFELTDVVGHIYEFSVDQHGSRFIQQQLERCSDEEKASVFEEVVPHTSKLMTDVFGNYVIQKLFEYGSPEQRENLASQLEGQILPLSFQMYGCRVIQKALEAIDLEQKARLVKELDGHVTRCVRDQNGNHVIQKCIECIPSDKIDFIISSFSGQVTSLSMHPYGCRVIQRVLEHCHDESNIQFIIDEILDTVTELARDQYGNYVTQHVLERGKPRERSKIIEKLAGCVVQLSQHKFASNVVEKCLEYGDSTSRDLLIKEIIGHGEKNDNLLMMMKDQYANYVIQKILRKCSTDQREVLLGLIKNHLTALKKYTYGKHIVARFEQLCGEEMQEAGP